MTLIYQTQVKLIGLVCCFFHDEAGREFTLYFAVKAGDDAVGIVHSQEKWEDI